MDIPEPEVNPRAAIVLPPGVAAWQETLHSLDYLLKDLRQDDPTREMTLRYNVGDHTWEVWIGYTQIGWGESAIEAVRKATLFFDEGAKDPAP